MSTHFDSTQFQSTHHASRHFGLPAELVEELPDLGGGGPDAYGVPVYLASGVRVDEQDIIDIVAIVLASGVLDE